jgi:hypothetical protein
MKSSGNPVDDDINPPDSSTAQEKKMHTIVRIKWRSDLISITVFLKSYSFAILPLNTLRGNLYSSSIQKSIRSFE